MKSLSIILGIIGFTLSAAFSIAHPQWNKEVPYPEGFRQWTHVKTTAIGKQIHNQGFNHIYANDKAMEGYESGKFPEGSVLIFDVIEASIEDSITKEVKRKHVDVMVKDSTRFANTGGWGYEEFKGDSREAVLTTQIKTQCFNCHSRQPDYVFSEFRK
jgi:hypothetical protein